MNRLIRFGCLLALCLLLSSCLVGPHYQRPVVSAPPAYRDADPAAAASIATASIADLKWAEVFKDEELKALIKEAVAKNFDLQIAAQRILEQQAQVGITRSQSLPSVNAGAGYKGVGPPSGLVGNNSSPKFYGGGLLASAAWNLDFWGLYRRQNEAERAKLLATEWGRRATLSSVVINVAGAYIQLRSLDAQFEITTRTVESRKQSLELASLRERAGSAPMSDVREAEQILFFAEANLPDLERQIREQENTISLYLGHNPGPTARGRPITEQEHPEDVPAGIPSQLLERRPDIQRAEAKLIAASARIGVARAQFFPHFSLTGVGGTATNQFTKLLSADAALFYFVGAMSEPIFNGGKLKNNLHLAEATKQEMVLTYQQAIASAFHDVSNALIDYRKFREKRVVQESETGAAKESVRLAHFRYDNGGSSYLEVLTNETHDALCYRGAEATGVDPGNAAESMIRARKSRDFTAEVLT